MGGTQREKMTAVGSPHGSGQPASDPDPSRGWSGSTQDLLVLGSAQLFRGLDPGDVAALLLHTSHGLKVTGSRFSWIAALETVGNDRRALDPHASAAAAVPVIVAEQERLWTLQVGILDDNAASLAVHRAAGFLVVGRRERLGQLVCRWRDVLLLERRSTVIGA